MKRCEDEEAMRAKMEEERRGQSMRESRQRGGQQQRTAQRSSSCRNAHFSKYREVKEEHGKEDEAVEEV